MNPLRSKVPGFIIVRPFLNGIKSFGTVDLFTADGPMAASVRRRKVSLAACPRNNVLYELYRLR